jgi:hypothetical protein
LPMIPSIVPPANTIHCLPQPPLEAMTTINFDGQRPPPLCRHLCLCYPSPLPQSPLMHPMLPLNPSILPPATTIVRLTLPATLMMTISSPLRLAAKFYPSSSNEQDDAVLTLTLLLNHHPPNQGVSNCQKSPRHTSHPPPHMRGEGRQSCCHHCCHHHCIVVAIMHVRIMGWYTQVDGHGHSTAPPPPNRR